MDDPRRRRDARGVRVDDPLGIKRAFGLPAENGQAEEVPRQDARGRRQNKTQRSE